MTTTIDSHALGQRIATLRRAHGWSQRRLADAAGVSHGYIALLELGRLPSPGKFRLDAVARALNLRTSDALTGPFPPRLAFESEVARELGSEAEGEGDAVPGLSSGNAEAPGRAFGTDEGPDAPSTPPGALTPLASPRSARPSPSRAALANAATLANAGPFEPADGAGHLSNVRGGIDQLRSSAARPLPVFRWGACGDPRDQESPPDPDHLEFPPPGRETLIGPTGFGVMVKGESMAGRGIFDGDVVWVNPERPYGVGKVVLALVSDVSGEAGMVVKTYARTEVGDCLLSESATGRSPVVCREFKVVGPVVGITSWRLPS